MLLTRVWKLLLLICLVLIAPRICLSQTKIHCKITSTDSSSTVYYFEPFNNYYNDIFNPKPIRIVNDTFSINLSSTKPGFVVLYIDAFACYIGTTGCDTITLKTDFQDIITGKSKDFHFEGDNAKGHILLNELFFEPMRKFSLVHDLQSKAKTIAKQSMLDSLQRIIKKETFPFEQLYWNGDISYAYLLMASTSIRSAMITEFLKPFVRKTSISKLYTDKEIDNLMDRIFREFNPLDPYYHIGIRSYSFPLDYNRYLIRDILADKSLRNRMVDSLVKGQNKLFPIDDFIPYVLFSQNDFRENIWGIQLYLIKRLFPEEVPLNDLFVFSYFYPNSAYLPYIKKLYERDLAKDEKLSDKVVIVDSLAKMNDLREIAESVQDSSSFIFVDLWASWCIPCKEQFEFNEQLDSVLAKFKITKAYIAIDQLLTKKSWLNDIKRYRLWGRHYIAGQELKIFLQNHVFKKDENFSIPRYILLNRSGEILNTDLPRPSSINLLEKQLNAIALKK